MRAALGVRWQLEVARLSARARVRLVLDQIGFQARRGEVLAVVGPNGAGKTTLLECIAGLRHRSEGEIALDARVLRGFHACAQAMAYMPDEIVLPSEACVRVMLGLDPAEPLVEAMSVRPLLAARGTDLSRREAKRAQLCSVLLEHKPLLLLDEPFAAFDPRQLRTLLPVFRAAVEDRITLVSVHQMRTAELVANRVLMLADGPVVALGTPNELRARAGVHDGPFTYFLHCSRAEHEGLALAQGARARLRRARHLVGGRGIRAVDRPQLRALDRPIRCRVALGA